MYGKLFESMYDGTLVESWQALITFQQMIILCDADGTIDMTPGAISRRTGIPLEHIEAGIEVLENPDPHSRSDGEEGRRIVRLDGHRSWGWYLVNHKKYKHLQDTDTVRAQNRERKRRQREREKASRDGHEESRNVTQCHAPSRYTDTDTDKTLPTEVAAPPVGEQPLKDQIWELGPKVLGNARADRSFLGKAIKDYGEGSVLHALRETEQQGTGDPRAYMQGILRNRSPTDGFGAFDD